MANFFKKFGPGILKQGLNAGGNAEGGKNNTAKEIAKEIVKKSAKTMAKKALTSKLAMAAGALLGKIIVIVIIIAVLVFPLSYAMMVYEGVLDSVYVFTIKAETNFLNEMKTFLADKDDPDVLDGVGENYENFLIKRFTYLNNKILSGKFTPAEAEDARSIAVGWVYGKIYSEFFKAPSLAEYAVEWLFGDVNELTKTPILKPIAQTATEIYAPEKGSNVEDSRREVFGDSINLYDIEAFDYMAGTLFDLMQLDVEALQKAASEEYKDEINAKIEEVKLNEARKQVKEILSNWALKVQYTANETNGLRKDIKDLGLENDKLVAYGKSSGIHNLHTFMKNNYSYTSSADYKWFINQLDSVDADGCEKGNSAEKVANALIQKSSDIERLANVASEIEKVYVEFIKSFGKTTEQQNTLKNKAKEYFKSTPFENIRKTFYDKYAYAIHNVEQSVSDLVSMKEVSEEMKQMIKDLNLSRTNQAALTYRNYLTELEDVTTIKYYSFDMKNEIFNTLYTIPIYDVNFFTENASKKTAIDELVNSDKYYGSVKVKKKFDKSTWYGHLPSVREKIYLEDRDNRNPIMFGIDSKTGTDYLSSNKSILVSDIHNALNDSIKELENIKAIVDSAKNPNSENYAENLAKIESYFWEDIQDTYWELINNEFYKYYYGVAYYQENHSNASAFSRDILNHTTNSVYWQWFTKGVKGGMMAPNTLIHTTDGPLLQLPRFEDINNPDDYTLGQFNQNAPFLPFALYMDDTYTSTAFDYWDIFVDYNALVRNFSEKADTINMIKNGLDGSPETTQFYDRLDQLISIEIERLNEYKTVIKSLEEVTFDNDPHGIIVKSNITKLFIDGRPEDRDKDYIIDDNELKVMKFKYTQEEAVKKTAETCFADIVAKMRGNSNKQNIVMNVGDLAIGTNTIPGAEDYDAFKRALNYLPIVEKVVKENYDLIDPYYLIAMIAAESSGIERPYVEGDANAGIMQIGSTHFGHTFYLPNGEEVVANPYEIANDPEKAIKLGLYFALKSASSFAGNLFMGVVGYNMGDGAMYRIIFLTLVGQGKVDMNAWTNPPSTWTAGIKDKAVQEMMVQYMVSGDLDWLNYRKPYQEENWYNTGTGTAHHLERVLSYYDTSQGMPWYRATKGGPKIIMGNGTGADFSIGDDEEGNKIYHKDNRLFLWREYYTDKDVFKKLDTWFSQKAQIEAEKAYLLSDTIIERINTLDTRYEKRLNFVDIDPLEFKALVAGTLNTGTTGFVNGDTSKDVISCTSGFKVNPATVDGAKKLVDAVILDYIDIYSNLNGKDKDFALYIYFSNNRDLAKIEVESEKGNFADFVKRKYKEDQESFTSTSSIFVKIAQTLSGDLNVNAKDFYNLLDNIGSNGDDAIIQNPIDLYYEEWLKAKYLMHEAYNSMISATNEERKSKGQTPFPLLPTYEEAVLNKNKNNALSDIEGTLTVKGPNGELYSVQIRKKFLSNQSGSATPSYIVIHDTGEGNINGTAEKQYEIMNSSSAKETMHYVVGTNEIFHLTENSKAANHINDSATSTEGTMSQITNSNSLGVQFEASVTRNKDKVFWHTVAITKYLMEQYNIQDYDKVVLHNDVTGVKDSKIMLDKDKAEWIKFKEALKNSTVTFSKNNANLLGTTYKLVETARSFLGQPYVYGATGQIVTDELITELRGTYGESIGEYNLTPRKFFDGTYKGFDCSGFVQYVYAQQGINIGRSTREQMSDGNPVFKDGESINEAALQPGDLLLSAKHVVMWIGNGEYIHASQPGDVVKIGKGIPAGTTTVRRIIEVNSGSFKFYSQHDPDWAYKTYCNEPMSMSACGPTSTAMVLSGLKYTNSPRIDTNGDGILTPDELANFSTANGTYDNDAGTDPSFYPLVGQELNIPVKMIYVPKGSNGEELIPELKAYLKAGKAIVASYTAGHWIGLGGHLVAFVGVDNNDKIIVHDPNLNTYETTKGDRFNGPNPDAYIAGPGVGAYFFAVFG